MQQSECKWEMCVCPYIHFIIKISQLILIKFDDNDIQYIKYLQTNLILAHINQL
jgi:hypothetical protein